MTKGKLNAKKYAELLFSKNKTFLEEFHISKKMPPLAIINIAVLAVVNLSPFIRKLYLEENGSEFCKDVAKEYKHLLKKNYLSEDIALIKTAVPLTSEEEEEIGERLASIFNHYFRLEIEVDPNIVGGIIIKVGDKVIDASILGKLKKLEKHLNKNNG